jgi:hypothetical protein
LSEDHANQLLAHSKMSHARLGLKAGCQARQRLAMDQIEGLGENKATRILSAQYSIYRSKKIISVTPIFPPLSMKNNMIKKFKTPLTGHQ